MSENSDAGLGANLPVVGEEEPSVLQHIESLEDLKEDVDCIFFEGFVFEGFFFEGFLSEGFFFEGCGRLEVLSTCFAYCF